MGEPQLLERPPGGSWRRDPQILSVHIAIGFEYTEQAESSSAEGRQSDLRLEVVAKKGCVAVWVQQRWSPALKRKGKEETKQFLKKRKNVYQGKIT